MEVLVRVSAADEAYEELVVNKTALVATTPETYLMLALQEILEMHGFFDPVFQGSGVWEYRPEEDAYVAKRIRPGWALVAQFRSAGGAVSEQRHVASLEKGHKVLS